MLYDSRCFWSAAVFILKGRWPDWDKQQKLKAPLKHSGALGFAPFALFFDVWGKKRPIFTPNGIFSSIWGKTYPETRFKPESIC